MILVCLAAATAASPQRLPSQVPPTPAPDPFSHLTLLDTHKYQDLFEDPFEENQLFIWGRKQQLEEAKLKSEIFKIISSSQNRNNNNGDAREDNMTTMNKMNDQMND